VIDFTGVPTENLGIAVIAGLNWLNHCSVLAGVPPEKFTRTLSGFRKVVRLGEQWWETEGAGSRCPQMLAERQKPPLMLYLIWSDYTAPCQGIAGAAIARAMERDRELLEKKFAGKPAELNAALAALSETMRNLDAAQEPEDLSAWP